MNKKIEGGISPTTKRMQIRGNKKIYTEREQEHIGEEFFNLFNSSLFIHLTRKNKLHSF